MDDVGVILVVAALIVVGLAGAWRVRRLLATHAEERLRLGQEARAGLDLLERAMGSLTTTEYLSLSEVAA